MVLNFIGMHLMMKEELLLVHSIIVLNHHIYFGIQILIFQKLLLV